MKYLLLVWMTLGSGDQSFATHDFANLVVCQNFRHWLEKDMQVHHLRAICVLKQDYNI